MSEICPKCKQLGTKFSRIIYGRKYVYFRHYNPETQKVRYCYIGPEEGYEYTERLHKLGLTNVLDQDYVDVAIQSILKAVERLSEELAKKDKNTRYEDALEIVLERLFKHLEKHRKAVENAYKKVFS